MPPVVRNPLTPESATTAPPSGGEPVTLSRMPSAVSVYIETAKDSDEFALAPEIVDFSGIKRELDDGEDTATLIVRSLDASKLSGAGNIGAQHLKHVLDLLHPDRRVRIAMPRGADAPIVLFQGYPISTSPSWSERHQAVTCQCLSEGQDRLRTTPDSHLVGRLMRYSRKQEWNPAAPDLVDVETLPPVFNPDGKPNMLAERLSIEVSDDGESSSRILFVFDEDDPVGFDEGSVTDSAFWNVADALRYVAHFYARKTGVSVAEFMADTEPFVGLVGSGDDSDPFARRMTARLENVKLQTLSARRRWPSSVRRRICTTNWCRPSTGRRRRGACRFSCGCSRCWRTKQRKRPRKTTHGRWSRRGCWTSRVTRRSPITPH